MFDIIWNRCIALNIYCAPVQKDQHLFMITPQLRKEVIETQLVPFLKNHIMLIAKNQLMIIMTPQLRRQFNKKDGAIFNENSISKKAITKKIICGLQIVFSNFFSQTCSLSITHFDKNLPH